MARDGKIDMRSAPTAEMLADCFTKPLLNHTFKKHCAAMEMNGIGLGNGLGNDLGILGIGYGNGIGTAVRK